MEKKENYIILKNIEGNQELRNASTGEVLNIFDPSFTGDEILNWVNNFSSKLDSIHDMVDRTNVMFDPVKQPKHYNSGKYEVIDMIESILSSLNVTPFQAYCLGNTLKYIARAGLKGDFTEDIRKALTYLHWAIGEDTRKCEKLK